MENALNQLDSPDSVTLLSGTAPEIGEALRQLGATPATIARAVSSFVFRKIPGAVVSRDMNGFMVGSSHLPERPSGAIREIATTQNRFVGLMAANDERFALAA